MFQYKDGLNVDVKEFVPEGSNIKGGLYYSDGIHICNFLGYGSYIREVEVPDNESQVIKYPQGDKWRSKSLFLHSRKYLGDIATWKWMIQNGVDITGGNDYAIRLASSNGHLELVDFLIKNGADCTADNNYAIRWASCNGHLSVVDLLLKNGADCTVLNNIAIRWASRNSHTKIVELLFKNTN